MLESTKFSNIDECYKELLHELLEGNYITSAPRGMPIHEIIGAHFVLTNSRARLIQNPARKLSLSFCLAEFLWIMCGHNDLKMIGSYNKVMQKFSDDGEYLHGGYGARLRHFGYFKIDDEFANFHVGFDQLANILKLLKTDPDSRQAILVILTPDIDLGIITKDVPCNVILQFFIRNGKLDAQLYVRSNDIVLGFPYDIFHWTLLQELMANELGIDIGLFYYTCGSLHLYQKDFDWAKKMVDSSFECADMQPINVNMPLLKWFQHINDLEYELRTTGKLRYDMYDHKRVSDLEFDIMQILGAKLGYWKIESELIMNEAFRLCLSAST